MSVQSGYEAIRNVLKNHTEEDVPLVFSCSCVRIDKVAVKKSSVNILRKSNLIPDTTLCRVCIFCDMKRNKGN